MTPPHCGACALDAPLDARFCSRCGAPFNIAAPEHAPTGPAYLDAWRGFRVNYPTGWQVLHPPIAGVAFDAPEGAAFVELSFAAAASPEDLLEARLRRFGPHETRALPAASPDEAALLFRHGPVEGQLRARVQRGQGALWLVQQPQGGAHDLTAVLQGFVGSLRPLSPVARHAWQEPAQGGLHAVIPAGWQVDSAIVVRNGGPQPILRVQRDESTWLVADPQLQVFVDAPPSAGGFWNQAAQLLGGGSEPRLPFGNNGLAPLLHEVLLPRWQGELPGCRLLSWENFGQRDRGEARVQLADGGLRVFGLQGVPLPSGFDGVSRWMGGIVSCYAGTAAALAEHEATLRGVLASVSMDRGWQGRQQAAFQHSMEQQAQQHQQQMRQQSNLHNQRMHDIQAFGDANTQLHNARKQAHDLQFQSGQQSSAASDRMQHDSINTIREREDYIDTRSGQVYDVAAGSERVWSDGQGHLFGGSWSIQPPADWHELKPWRPA